MWQRANVIAILNDAPLGRDALKTIARKKVKVFRAVLNYWWAETAKLKEVFPHLAPAKVSAVLSRTLRITDPKTQSTMAADAKLRVWQVGRVHGFTGTELDPATSNPILCAKKAIYIDENETDLMAALTLVHEYTHFQGGDEFAARKSEVDFLTKAPQRITTDSLEKWHGTYTQEWMTREGDNWSVTQENETAIKDYVQTIDPPGKYTYWTNKRGHTVYSFGNLVMYQRKDWESG